MQLHGKSRNQGLLTEGEWEGKRKGSWSRKCRGADICSTSHAPAFSHARSCPVLADLEAGASNLYFINKEAEDPAVKWLIQDPQLVSDRFRIHSQRARGTVCPRLTLQAPTLPDLESPSFRPPWLSSSFASTCKASESLSATPGLCCVQH